MHVLFSSTSTSSSSRPGTGTVVQKIEIHVEMGATHKRSKKSTRVPLCAHTGTMLLVFKELICLKCVLYSKSVVHIVPVVYKGGLYCVSAHSCVVPTYLLPSVGKKVGKKGLTSI